VAEAAIARYGIPEHLRSDNGPEFIAYCMQIWLKAHAIKTLYIKPGSPPGKTGTLKAFTTGRRVKAWTRLWGGPCGSLMFWVCLSGLSGRLGLPANLVVPAAWILSSAVLILRRQWFLDKSLSQKWLVGLQLFRAIGAVFFIEMTRGNIPGIFAYPAGIGDILVALAALAVLLRYRKATTIPPVPVFLVIVLGAADFLSAFFFGFTSSETTLQLFFPAVPNNVIVFPTGMIPLFLVPYAIFFHTLSALNYTMHDRNMAGGTTS